MRILVVGDIMLDRYVFVKTDRKAPEADIQVWDTDRVETRLGGAANVAHNLKALGEDEVEIFLAGYMDVGDQEEHLANVGIDDMLVEGGSTMVKTRYVSDQKIIFRHDNFKRFSSSGLEDTLRTFPLASFDAVVISDYNKGTVTREVVDELRKLKVPIFVDSKRLDLSMYRGMTVLKLNAEEYEHQSFCSAYPCVEQLFEAVVVTKGAKGAELRVYNPTRSVLPGNKLDVTKVRYSVDVEDFPTVATPAVDVTGCGDTHTAALAFSFMKRRDLRSSVKFANACARSVVKKFGTSVVEGKTDET